MADFVPNYMDDEEELEDYWEQAASRDALMFLVECNEDTFKPMTGDDGDSLFDIAVKCAQSVIKNKIISSERDFFSLVFFGTEKSNLDDFDHVQVLQTLDQPNVERVLQIQNIASGEAGDLFMKTYGLAASYSLADALWACSRMFRNCTKSLGSKRIMLFTNNDNPNAGSAIQLQAKKRAEDLRESDIDLVLMHVNKPGGRFDVNKFYKDFALVEDEDTVFADPSDKFEELLTRVRAKDHKKRTLGKVTMSLGKDLDMAVGIYNMVRTCPRPTPGHLYKKTNEPVTCVTKTVIAETGEVLMPQDLKRAADYEGKKVCFEMDELNEMKRIGPAGTQIKLLGFKPRDRIKRYHHVRAAQFLYPEERVVNGSCTVFTALLRKCLDRDVVAICLYRPRKNLAPRFVALLPQEEELDEHKVQITPPGFHVIFLPFADDFRALKMPPVNKANEEQIQAAKAMIHKLSFPFRSEAFDNPALQKHYAHLEAMALDTGSIDEPVDTLEPDVEAQERRAGKEIQAFKDLVFPASYSPNKTATKKAAGESGGGASKRAKADTGDLDVEAEARAGRLNKLTVPILREYVKSKKLTSGTKKADLIDAIKLHLGV